jgi:hypothetical protein
MEITPNTRGIDKTSRYKWVTNDQPGELLWLHKDALKINPDYQRDVITDKVKQLTADWSWLSCGALIVGQREGVFWVIDGQHRALAAKRRSDIESLPCLVFQTRDLKTEAIGFLDANTGRKPVTAIAKQKALVAAGDEVAAYVQQQVALLGLEIKSTANVGGQIKCIAWCTRRAADDRDAFRLVLTIGAELSIQDNMAVPERLLESLWLLHFKCGEGLADKRLTKRLREKGARVLLDAANRAAAYYANGGGKIWAEGVLQELNKGLHRKFVMNSAEP